LINFLEFWPRRGEAFMLLFHTVMAVVSGLLSMGWTFLDDEHRRVDIGAGERSGRA
jgi:hypothetical protein